MDLQPASDLAVNVSAISNGVSPPILQWAHKYRGVSASSFEMAVQLNADIDIHAGYCCRS